LPYYTEIFDFGPVGSGTETHTLSISYPKGDGIGFDYLELSTPAYVPQACPEGSIQEYVETVTVSAGSTEWTYSTNILEDGALYLLEASGTWQDKSQANHYIDAEYTTFDEWINYLDGTYNWGPQQKDLQVSGEFVSWGPYNPEHVYKLLYEGKGDSAGFRMFDGHPPNEIMQNWYPDNKGNLTVDIYKCAAAPDHFLGYKVKTTKVCDGGVTLLTLTNNGPTSNITVTSKDGVVFGPEGVSFSFGTEGVKLGTNITITSEIEGVVSETTIHTSCSQPIYPGLEFGDFEVVEGESLRGGPLETPAPDFFPCTVELTDQFETGVFTVDKPDKLYNPVDKNGEGINDHNTHLMGYKIKPFGILQHNPPFHECAPCKGGLTSLTLQYNGAQSAQIVVTAGIENEELFTRFISPGDPFSFIGTGTDRKLDKEINIWVDGDLATTIHTSCSQPIGTGQTFGDFKVVAGVSKDGGPICPIIKVESQLETVFVSRDKADRLLVPTAKSLTGPVDPLEETGIDHFKGYKIKAPKLPEDTPKITVTLVDQFDQPKTYIVEKPTRLFVPVDKNGEGIKNPGAHLICYKVKPAEGELKHVKVLGIYTNNQFGWLKLDTHKEEELLVPCMKIIQKD